MKGILLSVLLLLVPSVSSAATPKAATSPTIVFVGDQVTSNWPLTQTNPNWVNQGVPGARSYYVAADFQTAINLHPNIIHIMVGVVDQEYDVGDSAPAWMGPGLVADLRTMVQEARAANIQVLLGLEPSSSVIATFGEATNNAVVAAFGAQNNIPVIGYQNVQVASGPGSSGNYLETGGVPTYQGYQQMTAILESVLATMNLTLGGGYLQNTRTGLGYPTATNVNQAATGEFLQFTPVGWFNDGSVHPLINPNYAGATGTWTSSNPLVITLDQTGYGEVLTAGTTIIRYTSPNGVAFSEWIMYTADGN